MDKWLLSMKFCAGYMNKTLWEEKTSGRIIVIHDTNVLGVTVKSSLNDAISQELLSKIGVDSA